MDSMTGRARRALQKGASREDIHAIIAGSSSGVGDFGNSIILQPDAIDDFLFPLSISTIDV
jgi:hypothetical protein